MAKIKTMKNHTWTIHFKVTQQKSFHVFQILFPGQLEGNLISKSVIFSTPILDWWLRISFSNHMKLICWPVIEKDIIANLADFLWIFFFKALHFRAGILCMIKGEVRNPNVFSHIEVSYLASKASLEGILEGMPPAFFRRFVWNQPVCWHQFFAFTVFETRQKRSHL